MPPGHVAPAVKWCLWKHWNN